MKKSWGLQVIWQREHCGTDARYPANHQSVRASQQDASLDIFGSTTNEKKPGHPEKPSWGHRSLSQRKRKVRRQVAPSDRTEKRVATPPLLFNIYHAEAVKLGQRIRQEVAEKNSLEYGLQWTWNLKKQSPSKGHPQSHKEQHGGLSEDYEFAVCRRLDPQRMKWWAWNMETTIQGGDATLQGEVPQWERRGR